MLRLEPEHVAAGMMGTLLCSFAVAGVLVAVILQQAARESARASAAAHDTEAGRRRLEMPPKCTWELRSGKRYVAYLTCDHAEAGSDARCLANMIRCVVSHLVTSH